MYILPSGRAFSRPVLRATTQSVKAWRESTSSAPVPGDSMLSSGRCRGPALSERDRDARSHRECIPAGKQQDPQRIRLPQFKPTVESPVETDRTPLPSPAAQRLSEKGSDALELPG